MLLGIPHCLGLLLSESSVCKFLIGKALGSRTLPWPPGWCLGKVRLCISIIPTHAKPLAKLANRSPLGPSVARQGGQGRPTKTPTVGCHGRRPTSRTFVCRGAQEVFGYPLDGEPPYGRLPTTGRANVAMVSSAANLLLAKLAELAAKRLDGATVGQPRR